VKERYGDIFAWPNADGIVVPTNCSVRSDGAAVMGRGVALAAAQRWPDIPWALGARLRAGDTHVFRIASGPGVFIFPVKNKWQQNADLDLIARSASELVDVVIMYHCHDVVLPRVGTGNGRLSWDLVRPVLALTLDDRFTVLHNGPAASEPTATP